MSDVSQPPGPTHEVAVQLLDPTSGRPLKSWIFRGQTQITIGRSADQHVELSDPYVSRNHANLQHRDGRWWLVALGRNGVMVGTESVSEYAVQGDVSFRLGMEGPTMRFCTTAEQAGIAATVCFDTLPEPVIQLDERKLRDAVGEIADGEYFQQLQQKAKQMRHERQGE